MVVERPPTVAVEQLVLSLPGLAAADARAVAEAALERVAARLPADGSTRELGALQVQVPVQWGANHADLIEAIAEAILRGLR